MAVQIGRVCLWLWQVDLFVAVMVMIFDSDGKAYVGGFPVNGGGGGSGCRGCGSGGGVSA